MDIGAFLVDAQRVALVGAWFVAAVQFFRASSRGCAEARPLRLLAAWTAVYQTVYRAGFLAHIWLFDTVFPNHNDVARFGSLLVVVVFLVWAYLAVARCKGREEGGRRA